MLHVRPLPSATAWVPTNESWLSRAGDGRPAEPRKTKPGSPDPLQMPGSVGASECEDAEQIGWFRAASATRSLPRLRLSRGLRRTLLSTLFKALGDMLAYMKRTTLKISDALDARLRHEAERRGTTMSEVSREALEAYLGRRSGRRSFLAAKAGRSGRSDVSGAIRGDPRDRGRAITRAGRRRRAPVRVRRR